MLHRIRLSHGHSKSHWATYLGTSAQLPLHPHRPEACGDGLDCAHVRLGALNLGNRSSGRATDHHPLMLALDNDIAFAATSSYHQLAPVHHTYPHGCPPRHVALHDRLLLHASLTAILTPISVPSRNRHAMESCSLGSLDGSLHI
jgi:hypothetical protein